MSNYAVEFTKSAQKELGKLPRVVGVRIAKAIGKLSSELRTGNVRPMVATKGWRLRVGDYEVVTEVRTLIMEDYIETNFAFGA